MNFDSFVLAAATDDLSVEPAAREYADALEFRMDLAEKPLAQLSSYAGTLPIIATNRVVWEGGETPDSESRLEELQTALDQDAVEAVDLELDALEDGDRSSHDASKVAQRAREQGVSVIASLHDFESTPGREELDALLDRTTAQGDVGKLAVTATDLGALLELLAATWAQTVEGRRIATMAMGERGRHTRALCPVYGSKIGYAPVEPADATAPGQYDLETLRALIDDLGGPAEPLHRTEKV